MIEKDTRDIPLAKKVIEDKPKSIQDRCTNGAGVDEPATACDTTVQAYATPRIVAGMPQADDTIKCELAPLNRASYAPATFTDAEWKSLVDTYPKGVCDYSKPGVGRRPTVPWQTYQDKSGKVIYGGRGLGGIPSSKAVRAHACVDKRGFVFRFHRSRGARVVAVQVFVNGKRRVLRRGHDIKRVRIKALPRRSFTVRVVTTFSNGSSRASTRTYKGCKKSKPRTSRRR